MKEQKVCHVSEEERQELLDFYYREEAINDLLSKCLVKQEAVRREKDAWFEKIRGKYELPETAEITVNHSDGSVSVEERQADPKK